MTDTVERKKMPELKLRQERTAREYIHRQKQAKAERKSRAAAERAQKQMEKAAQERLKMLNIEEKLGFARGHWAKMREAADKREANADSKQFNPFKQESSLPSMQS
ncbi:hypothetical protein CSAL01_03429 [Colletotrichum salicis]|uniref:Uncharacterized protein n=1 Tax=Colletotrichum salicis TaxID=1209931 RepID=A0A135U8A5_9PEZI|nr:hypothetical protein CSAL01_03429 [Colletotrichum salicis]